MSRIVLLFSLFSFFCLSHAIAQLNYNFFISNSGSDTNPGTSKLFPRRTIAGTAALLKNFAGTNGGVTVGLESGSVFNEAMSPSSSIKVGAYAPLATQENFAILSGSERFDTGWKLLMGTINTYEQNIPYSGFAGSGINGIGGYSFIYVIEIDRQTEQTNPLTARKILQFVPRLQTTDSIAGSFFEPLTYPPAGTGNIKVSIHTSNNLSPNANPKYRYEVTVRGRAIDSYNSNSNHFENLWIRGFGAGIGSLPGGSNTSYKKVIFGPGAGIHSVVVKDGIFNNCLFLPTGNNISTYAIVFYNVQGFNQRNRVVNTLFLDNLTPIYSHTSNGSNYNLLELNNVVAFADSNSAKVFASASNTDTISLQKISTYGYYSSYSGGTPKYVSIKDSYFHYAGDGISFSSNYVDAVVDNVFITGKNNSRCIKMDLNTHLKLTNSIIQVSATNSNGFFIARTDEGANSLVAEKNIFIGKVNNNKYAIGGNTNTNSGIGTSKDKWDYNVYIQVSGNISWSVSNPSTNGGITSVQSFSEWQRQSGQDQHSLFFDLRNDPRGLQAIFIDPDNGNYELANTVEGNQVKALGAGMTAPLHCFLKKPTYEEAAEMIRTENVPTVNSCRNPCQQAKPAIHFSVAPDASGVITVCQNDSLTIGGSASFLQNDTYYHQSDVKQRYLWWASDRDDTSGINLHTFTHKFVQAGPTNVRLQMVDENGCSYDTMLTVKVNPLPLKPDLGKDTFLCTGQMLPLAVINKQVDDVYAWSTGTTGSEKIDVTAAGTYLVQSANSFGCKVLDTIEVLNKTPLTISLGVDTMYCSSSPNLLTTVTTGQISGYQWNTGAVTDSLRISSAGTYIVTVKDFGVCLARDTVTITDNPVNLYSLPTDTIICEGTHYTLTLAPPPATSITWSDGIIGYTHPITGGAYSITASNSGCIKRDEMNVAIQRLPVVSLGADVTLCNGYDLPLAARYPGAAYLWSTGSSDSTIIAHNEGIYWVQAAINGCGYRDSMQLKLESCQCTIHMPNAFSPNGDGINDVVRASIECFPAAFNLSIFNRYGQLVYSSRDYKGAWDGRFNGKPQPVGTYYYILSFRNESLQQSKPFSGSITLLR